MLRRLEISDGTTFRETAPWTCNAISRCITRRHACGELSCHMRARYSITNASAVATWRRRCSRNLTVTPARDQAARKIRIRVCVSHRNLDHNFVKASARSNSAGRIYRAGSRLYRLLIGFSLLLLRRCILMLINTPDSTHMNHFALHFTLIRITWRINEWSMAQCDCSPCAASLVIAARFRDVDNWSDNVPAFVDHYRQLQNERISEVLFARLITEELNRGIAHICLPD